MFGLNLLQRGYGARHLEPKSLDVMQQAMIRQLAALRAQPADRVSALFRSGPVPGPDVSVAGATLVGRSAGEAEHREFPEKA